MYIKESPPAPRWLRCGCPRLSRRPRGSWGARRPARTWAWWRWLPWSRGEERRRPRPAGAWLRLKPVGWCSLWLTPPCCTTGHTHTRSRTHTHTRRLPTAPRGKGGAAICVGRTGVGCCLQVLLGKLKWTPQGADITTDSTVGLCNEHRSEKEFNYCSKRSNGVQYHKKRWFFLLLSRLLKTSVISMQTKTMY